MTAEDVMVSEGAVDEEKRLLQASSAELLSDGRRGLRIKGWIIESINAPILRSLDRDECVFPSFSLYSCYFSSSNMIVYS